MAVISLGPVTGCGREDAKPVRPTSAPTTAHVTAPGFAEFRIDGLAYRFEQPRAAIDRDAGRILIYSADEKAAGSFYFEVPLDSDASLDEGQTISWEQQLQGSEMQDSLVGINPPANKDVLQPQNLRIDIRFLPHRLAEVSIEGRFLMFTGEVDTSRGVFPVSARFVAAVDE